MGFAAPLGLLGLTLLAPIIMMYLLKRRREEVPVSSTFLWERVVQDIEANAPWQRLRRNLLLLLQLLFLLLAVLGLAQPFVRTAGAAGQSLIIVIDTSISMAATDTLEGTRLDAARAEALRLMEGLPADGRITVIRAGGGAEVIAANTADRIMVQEALGALKSLAPNSDLSQALTLAAAAAARQPQSEIIILSDGAVQLPDTLAVDRPVRYVSIGGSHNNQAISALELTPRDAGHDLFVQVTNYSTQDVTRRLVVEVEGTSFSAADLTIPGDQASTDMRGQSTSKIFFIEQTGDFQVRAFLEGEDSLPGDDEAWAVPPPSEAHDVQLISASENNRFLGAPFKLMDVNFRQRDVLTDTEAIEGEESADLMILDRWLPDDGLPGTTENLLIVAPPPGNNVIRTTGVITAPFPVKTGNLPAIEDNLFFEEDLFFVEARVNEVPSWGTVVLENDQTRHPLLWVGEYEGRRIAVLNLAIYGEPESIAMDSPKEYVLTNLVYHPVYPVLMATLAEYLLAGPVGELAGGSVLPGELVTLPLMGAERVEVELPSGRVINLSPREGERSVAYVPDAPGPFAVRWPGTDQEPVRFTVNLFAPSESAIAPQPDLRLVTGGGGSATESGLSGEARFGFWQPLLLVALVILAIEWMIYQRDAIIKLRSHLARNIRKVDPR